MELTEDTLGSFEQLACAIGLTTTTGANSAWFGDPVGGTPSNPTGLKTMLSNTAQREALTAFVDEVLGPPAARTSDSQQWIPVFHNNDPTITVSAVVEALPASVRLGVGVEHSTGQEAPFVTTRLHVPLIHVANGASDDRDADGHPKWLLLGQSGGVVEIEVDATFEDAAPTPGEAHLGGASVRLGIPTNGSDDVEFALTLRDLQVPGATVPSTHTLEVDSLDELGTEVFELIVGLVRAQVAALDTDDHVFRHIAGLAGMLGLREVADIPPLPIADLPSRGPIVLVQWVEQVLGNEDARDAWLAELARLVGGTPIPARDAVSIELGDAAIVVGLRVTPGAAGRPVLTPWAELSYGTRAGVSVGGGIDLMRIDTGGGTVRAVPQIRATAVFGADAEPGASRLVAAGPVQIGSVHIGVRLDDLARPAFALTLHDVDIDLDADGGGAPRHHDMLDLSTPDAALDAVDSVIDSALSGALDGLGVAGDLIEQLLGIAPPAGIADISIVDLVADPMAAVRGYYTELLGDADAMAEVLGTFERLVSGGPGGPVDGTGVKGDPWRVRVASTGGGAGLGLAVWKEGDHLIVAVAADLAIALTSDALTGLQARSDLRFVLLDADLAAGRVALAPSGFGRLLLAPAGDDPLVLSLGVAALEFSGAGAEVGWSSGAGLHVDIVGDGLTFELTEITTVGAGTFVGDPLRIALPLPTFDANGALTWVPDWDDVERLLARLLTAAELPVIDALLDLVGWRTATVNAAVGAHLSLSALIDDPPTAIANWAADLALDCSHLSTTLGILTTILSGGAMREPAGLGRVDIPYRSPIAGNLAAPAVVAWTEPPCPPPTARMSGGAFELIGSTGISAVGEIDDAPPPGGHLAEGLRHAAVEVPGLADLLFARSGLGNGFDQLVARWTGTDGITGPSAVPGGVTSLVLPGFGYAELAALGRSSTELVDDLTAPSGAVAHVGCDADWGAGYPVGEQIDATGGASGIGPPSGRPAAIGDGRWFVRLAAPTVAAASRADRDGVAAQAAQLIDVLQQRTDPIVLVGYGAAGAAAVRAAATATQVNAVVTVGTPWSAISVTSTQTGLGGDALALTHRLLPSGPAPDELGGAQTTAPGELLDVAIAGQGWPVARGVDLIRRGMAVKGPADLPSAGAEALRPGLEVKAVFGAITAIDATAALTSVLIHAVTARSAAAVAETAAMAVQRPDHLHLGVDVPVLSADLGGLTIGAGATVELVHLARASSPSDPPTLEAVREVIVTLNLGVTDGWLIGGPGAPSRDIEVRWLQARVHVPLSIGGAPPAAGFTELILHEARAFAASRERWVIRADGLTNLAGDLSAATTALPEVKIILGEVVARIRAAVPTLAAVLARIGVIRDDGLDPSALDRLLFDPGATLRPIVSSDPAALAAAVNTLIGAAADPARPASAIDLGVAGATLRFDLASRRVSGTAVIDLAGMPPVTLGLDAGPTGAGLQLQLGALDPSLGGVALVASAATGTGVALRVDHRGPSDPLTPAATTSVAVLPTPDVDGLTRLAATIVPAAVAQALASGLRSHAVDEGRAALDAALAALGLLSAPADNGTRRVVLPVGLITDPGQWLLRRADPLGAVVALMDALAPIVAPDRGTDPGWPIDPALGVTYALVSGRLELAAQLHLATTLDGAAVELDVAAGLSLSTTAPPQPVVDAALTIDGWGIRLRVQPSLTVELLRPAPTPPLALYPAGAGLGGALVGAGVSLLPTALNALADRRNDAAASLVKDVGAAVYEVGDAMGLMDGAVGARQFTLALITTFADDPAAALLARLPAMASAGLAALAEALDPAGNVVTTSLTGTVRRFAFGATGAIHVDLDGAAGQPAIDLGGRFTIESNGTTYGDVVIEHLRLTPSGIQVDARLGPVRIDLGSMVLRPIVVVRAGVTSGSFTRLIGLGVGLDDAGAESVEFRWTLDAQPPTLVAVTRTSTGESLDTDLAAVGVKLLAIAISLASGILSSSLEDVISNQTTARLQGVVFTGGNRTIDPTLVTDLFDPQALLDRLMTLAWNCSQGPNALSVTIDDTVTLALASVADGPNRRLGLSVSLAAGTRLRLASGDVNVDLEVDATWVDPAVPAGLAVYGLRGPNANSLTTDLAVSVAGVGLRFTKTSGPLLELGAIGLDGLAVHLYGEVSSTGVGGGVRLQLSGLAVSPGGAGGDNGMANSLLSDAGSAGANNRPNFSPSLSIQRHPGQEGVSIGLRAGDPPGPWWVVIQRQLGPIYLDRIGLNTVEQGGQIRRVSLLFTGSVSLFGLSAAVDQLSLNWEGGDILRIENWSADVMGFAVSADIAGASLAGGLLKSVDNEGVVSYVGMLVGRFATYGLSVFGGYASDPEGHASFFVFGGVTGPLGGPPAFFLTGIGGGLGINRGLVIPTDLSNFGEFPFIQALDPAATAPDNPLDKLRELNTYFPHSPGNFWFAAGISFNSFALVDGVAVVAVSFGNGLDINLLGLARMALPRPGAALVSIELALLARFSTSEGVFMIKAQLTDNSWLLYEDIRLTGGFAFAIWWKGPLAGQFVLSMGGYHPNFRREGYPDVPRLGLVWQISDAIVMKGESYFALTSEALMAGTGVSVSVDFGWVWARLEFGADGIVYFDPFFFDVRAYCRISAGIDIDLGLFSISLSLTLGASIHVWGPDFAGEVVFEIGPCEVPIAFGPQAQQPGDTLNWSEFVAKYLEDAGGGQARALSGITGRGTLPTATGGEQGAPSADGSLALPFQVFAEFEISFITTVPTTSFVVAGATKSLPVTLSNGANGLMGLAPMGAGDLTSSVTIALKRRSGSTWVTEPDLSKLAANLTAAEPDAAGSYTTTDSFPTGVWGPPKSLTAAVKPVPSGDVLVTGNRVVLVAGVETLTQGPPIDYYQVESGRRPLPLSAIGTLRVDLLDIASGLGVVAPATTAAALASAAATLFAPGAAANLGAEPSALGRAAYAFDRVAPPRFGNLADGLALANGDNGARDEMTAPGAKTPPVVRSPFVAGYFSSGVGAAARPTRTTVSDGRIKRRRAPTTDSVRGRLGLHIAATLEQTAPPAVLKQGTMVASLAVPRTEVGGAVRTVTTGSVGLLGLNRIVTGIGGSFDGPLRDARGSDRSRDRRRGGRGRRPRAPGVPERIATGDVVTLQFPDAAIDADAERPSVAIGGRARVVIATAHGVVHDDDAIDTSVTVPNGATMLAIQADGDADAFDGYSGWHDRSRVALLANRCAIGAGCAITVDGRGADQSLGWATAGRVVIEASRVHTRFSRPVRTLAIALDGVAPRNLQQTEIHLIGGSITRNRAGLEQPPTVVTLGATTVLVYAITPDRNAQHLTVSIVPGSEWVVAAVLGGGGPNETPVTPTAMAERIARSGLVAVTAQLTVMQGPGCTASWQPADDDGPLAAPAATARKPKKAAAKTAPAKKTPAKKTPAKKTPAKKTPAKKTPANTATADRRTPTRATRRAVKTGGRTTATKRTVKQTAAPRTAPSRSPRRSTR